MRIILIVLTITSALNETQAKNLNQTIVGCVEVGCPSAADNVDDNCTVVDRSFPYIGLTRLPAASDSLAGISWTKGFNITDDPDSVRTFHSSFYLGKPPDLKLDDTGACAVFLHGVYTTLTFGDDVPEASQGTCLDAMGSGCVSALINRAKALFKGLGNDTVSGEDDCAKLQDELEKNMDDACLQVSKGSWTNLTSTVLIGHGVSRPISAQQNVSSTCWPVIPKQNQLTLVSEYQTQGSLLISDAAEAEFAITPILTVFYPTGKGSIIDNVDASLSCVKVVGPPLASVDTMQNGKSSAPALLSGSLI
ncbi:hypothetical protein F5Y19DRAFT_405725 [Xylariaceae sp. FL1651]|nr:hypothetical protein F5Y19DRAFT_405725 [Xylariaceae sp. FL1651]